MALVNSGPQSFCSNAKNISGTWNFLSINEYGFIEKTLAQAVALAGRDIIPAWTYLSQLLLCYSLPFPS
jgi:hypothetical protein